MLIGTILVPSAEEITAFTRAIRCVAEKTGIIDSGYRVISNIGQHGHQEVPHLHMHVLGGGPIGRLSLVNSRIYIKYLIYLRNR